MPKIKIPGITNLATKATLNTEATEIESKTPYTTSFITTPEFYKLAEISFHVRMKEAKKSLAGDDDDEMFLWYG